MKTVSAGLGAHLGLEVTTLCTLWRVVRVDGRVFAFTDHSENITYPAGSPTGDTYLAATGYTRSAIQTTGALSVDNLELEGVFDSVGITEADLRAGLWDYASVTIALINWASLSDGVLLQRRGQMGEVNSGRYEFRTELRGLTQKLQQSVGRVYGPLCDADFGDARCGIILTGSPTSPYVKTGTVTSVDTNRVFYDTSRADAVGFFDYGKITFNSGLNSGLSMEIKTFSYPGSPVAVPQFALQLTMPYAVIAGDAYTAIAGCKKRVPDCVVFNNILNFRGFPYVPSLDQVASGGL